MAAAAAASRERAAAWRICIGGCSSPPPSAASRKGTWLTTVDATDATLLLERRDVRSAPNPWGAAPLRTATAVTNSGERAMLTADAAAVRPAATVVVVVVDVAYDGSGGARRSRLLPRGGGWRRVGASAASTRVCAR